MSASDRQIEIQEHMGRTLDLRAVCFRAGVFSSWIRHRDQSVQQDAIPTSAWLEDFKSACMAALRARSTVVGGGLAQVLQDLLSSKVPSRNTMSIRALFLFNLLHTVKTIGIANIVSF
jgi:hypothetical protein